MRTRCILLVRTRLRSRIRFAVCKGAELHSLHAEGGDAAIPLKARNQGSRPDWRGGPVTASNGRRVGTWSPLQCNNLCSHADEEF